MKSTAQRQAEFLKNLPKIRLFSHYWRIAFNDYLNLFRVKSKSKDFLDFLNFRINGIRNQ